jgi:glyoxylase-like metal-dependent hydrolase (beta-lactamase superfamily II)
MNAPRDKDRWLTPGARPVGHGVHRIPCPLPGDGLAAVNVYAAQLDDGVALIDTGWRHPKAVGALESALATLGFAFEDVRSIICTHAHYDHYGLAHHLRVASGSSVALGRVEAASLDVANDRQLFERSTRHRTEWMAALDGLDLLAEMERDPGEEFDAIRAIASWDRPTQLVDDGQRLRVGALDLEVIETPGDTRGHVMYLDHASRLLFAGDHVLPHITPSLGFEPFEDGRALKRYLASLERVRDLDVSLVLPGHGSPFEDFRGRVDELLAHHQSRLDDCVGGLRDGWATTLEVARGLRWTGRGRAFSELDTLNQMLAVQETATHLELLAERAVLDREGHAPRRYAIAA